MKIQVYQRNYLEYNLDNIIEMGPDAFGELLSKEIYSLVLVYRLLELMDNFVDMEEFLFCHHIQVFFDEINFKMD